MALVNNGELENQKSIILFSIDRLVKLIQASEIKIYNEFGVQHELGIILRSNISGRMKVQFERSVNYFGLKRIEYIKKEIDISIFSMDQSIKYAIEIKSPRNGQYPEQMYSSCKDIVFLEQLVNGGFNACFFLMIVDDPLFYQNGNKTGIYRNFRGSKPINGEFRKPTGEKDELIIISGTYPVIWKTIQGSLKYFSLVIS